MIFKALQALYLFTCYSLKRNESKKQWYPIVNCTHFTVKGSETQCSKRPFRLLLSPLKKWGLILSG